MTVTTGDVAISVFWKFVEISTSNAKQELRIFLCFRPQTDVSAVLCFRAVSACVCAGLRGYVLLAPLLSTTVDDVVQATDELIRF